MKETSGPKNEGSLLPHLGSPFGSTIIKMTTLLLIMRVLQIALLVRIESQQHLRKIMYNPRALIIQMIMLQLTILSNNQLENLANHLFFLINIMTLLLIVKCNMVWRSLSIIIHLMLIHCSLPPN